MFPCTVHPACPPAGATAPLLRAMRLWVHARDGDAALDADLRRLFAQLGLEHRLEAFGHAMALTSAAARRPLLFNAPEDSALTRDEGLILDIIDDLARRRADGAVLAIALEWQAWHVETVALALELIGRCFEPAASAPRGDGATETLVPG